MQKEDVTIPSGEKNGQSKITADIAEKIRIEYSLNDPSLGRYQRKKISQTSLGQKYGISQSVVGSILRGEYWKVGMKNEKS